MNRNPPAGVLPPWHTRYKPATHKPALIDFTVGELMHDDAALEEDAAGYDYYSVATPRVLRSLKPVEESRLTRAKDAARYFGNLKPLRELFPEITEFISEPKRKRGVRRPKHPLEKYAEDYTEEVDGTVRRVRRIWREYFGRWKCGRGDDNPTNEIVATYLSIVGSAELSEAKVKRVRKAMSR